MSEAEVEMDVGLLPLASLVAVVARDVGAAVLAALELMDDSRCLLAVTLCATTGGANQFRQRLISVGPVSRAMNQDCGQ